MVVLGWTIGLIWGCSLLVVAALFFNAGRRSRTARDAGNPADHPVPRREQQGLESGQQVEPQPLAPAASESTVDA